MNSDFRRLILIFVPTGPHRGEGMCPGEGHIRREGLLFRGAQTAEDVRDVLCAIRITQQHGGDQNDQFVP